MAKYEIEIPDGVIPHGHAPVAFREPQDREPIVSNAGPIAWADFVIANGPRLILRKVEPVRESRWFPAGRCWGYGSLQSAIAAYPKARIARYDLENGVPVSVTLEPK